MRGCSSKQYGGAPPLGNSAVGGNGNKVELSVGNSSPHQIEGQMKSAHNLLALKQLGGDPPKEYTQNTQINVAAAVPAAVPATTGQNGGYKSKHRRRRYKKSIGRKGRSRRFRGSRK